MNIKEFKYFVENSNKFKDSYFYYGLYSIKFTPKTQNLDLFVCDDKIQIEILFEEIEAYQLMAESHFMPNDEDATPSVISPFLFEIECSAYVEYIKHKTLLGLAALHNPKDLNFYLVMTQNIGVEVVTKKEPEIKIVGGIDI